MKNASIFLALVATAIISGCEVFDAQKIPRSMYNVRETGVSEFDGTKYVRMRNVECPGKGVNVLFDLYQDSRSVRVNQVVLKAKVTGIHSIRDGKSLHFNIDGEFMDFETRDHTTGMEELFPNQYGAPSYAPGMHASTRQYLVPEASIEKVGKGKRVVVRVDLSDSYAEGRCSAGEEERWTKQNEWMKELAGTAGFRGFSEMTRTLH
jgi:hypothetical protein